MRAAAFLRLPRSRWPIQAAQNPFGSSDPHPARNASPKGATLLKIPGRLASSSPFSLWLNGSEIATHTQRRGMKAGMFSLPGELQELTDSCPPQQFAQVLINAVTREVENVFFLRRRPKNLGRKSRCQILTRR